MNKIFKIAGDDTEHIDIQSLPLYTRTWNTGNSIEVYGYKVQMPDPPSDEYCVNFGLEPYDQVFRRVWIPPDLQYWKDADKEEFIEREWHRRKEGMWYFINGTKVYLPGTFWFFISYWTLQTGKKALFRMSDLDFFLIWQHVVRTVTIYGLVVFKCRRIGDSEKSIAIVYEYASRVKNTINGMQDCRKEEEIFKTYQRLTFAHEKMIWFMKPINRGTTNPKANLEFKMPEEKITMKKQLNLNNKNLGDEVEFEFEALGSEINYYVSNPEATDGKRHGRIYIDEFGKGKKLNPIEAWRYAKKSLVDEIYETISGKALFTSTVEEEERKTSDKTSESKMLEVAQQMWDDSDPENLNDNGETTSGMIRIVRGALERGKPDRFGFTDKERLKEKIEADKRHLIQQKKWKQLVEYQRQNCIDISDIFTSMAGDSGFNVENLVQREFRLKYEIKPQKWVRGNFEWKDFKKPDFSKKQKIEVVWIPNDNGRWVVSGHPKDWNLRANAMSDYSVIPKPNNIHAFCTGIDPVAQKDVLEKNPSLGGLAVKRKFDPMIDGDKFDDEGNPEFGGEYFSTNRYVCAYLYRHKEPTDNYEDWLKTLIYYGSDFLIEKNHSAGFQTFLEGIKFHGYYMGMNTTLKNYKGQSEQWGLSANEKTIDHYFGLLATLTNKWWNTIDIPIIIEQLKSMNYENKGKKDLGVACGICEVAGQRELPSPKNREEEKTTHFEEFVV